MWEALQAHLFLEMILFDSKPFSYNECLPRKSPTEIKLQFTFTIFHILHLYFFIQKGISGDVKKFVYNFADFTASELSHSVRLKV